MSSDGGWWEARGEAEGGAGAEEKRRNRAKWLRILAISSQVEIRISTCSAPYKSKANATKLNEYEGSLENLLYQYLKETKGSIIK